MKLYQVSYYVDGYTVKAPGVSETQIRSVDTFFVAESFEKVWERIEDIRNDPERELRAIAVVAEAVEVLK